MLCWLPLYSLSAITFNLYPQYFSKIQKNHTHSTLACTSCMQNFFITDFLELQLIPNCQRTSHIILNQTEKLYYNSFDWLGWTSLWQCIIILVWVYELCWRYFVVQTSIKSLWQITTGNFAGHISYKCFALFYRHNHARGSIQFRYWALGCLQSCRGQQPCQLFLSTPKYCWGDRCRHWRGIPCWLLHADN